MEQLELSTKTALVTGSGRGIGRAIAILLARQDASVIVAARTTPEIDRVVEEIKADGGTAYPLTFDLAAQRSIQSLFTYATKMTGALDILVNNAGVGLFGKMHEFSIDNLQTLLDVNVRGTYLCCQEALKVMIPKRSGTIINISSVVGFKGYPNQSAYTASKHAIIGMTKSLAVEAQEYNIRASVINPGGTATDLAATARPDLDPSTLMQPEDVAQAVLYLLSLSESCAIDDIYIRRRGSKPF